MRNKLYKSILLFACLFISTTVINAATGSGSAALVNIRNTIIGRSSYKVAGYYNTTKNVYEKGEKNTLELLK